MTAMTAAAGVRLGLKVWIAVGGPVFAVALVVMGWDVAHLKLQDALRMDAQSPVAGAAVTVSAARLAPPWERKSGPDYPVSAMPQKVSVFSYKSPYKHGPDVQAAVEASTYDDLFIRPRPAPAPRVRHRRR